MKLMKTLLLVSLGVLCNIGAWAQQFYDEGILYEVSSRKLLTVRLHTVGRCMSSFTVPEYVAGEDEDYAVTSIGFDAFRYSRGLQGIDFNKVELIEDGYVEYAPDYTVISNHGAFFNCTGLLSLDFGNITHVGDYAFIGCRSLKDVVFGQKMESIGENVFLETDNIKNVTVKSENPPVCKGDIFTSEVYKNATLHVPHGTKEAFQKATGWKPFVHIVDDQAPTGVEDLAVAECVKVSYQLGQLTVTGAERGEGIAVYDWSGRLLKQGISQGQTLHMTVDLFHGGVVKVGKRSFKVSR